MKDVFDLAVIGAGPAGAACALAASRAGLDVALFEQRAGPGDKPCGEGLMPDGVDALRSLGLEAVLLHGRPFSTLRFWIAGTALLDVPLPGTGLALERPRLQAALESALASSSRIRIVRERAVLRGRGPPFSVESPSACLRARAVAIAEGLGASSVPWLSRRRAAASRFGLRARFEPGSRPLDEVEVHLGNPCSAYLTPLRDGRTTVALLFDRIPDGVRGPGALLEWARAAHPRAFEGMGELATPAEGRSLARPRPRLVARDGLFLLGDAGGSVDPIVGCGVTVALRTGIAAALAAAQLARGRSAVEVERAYALVYREQTLARRRLAGLLASIGPRPALARGLAGVLAARPKALQRLVRLAEPAPSSRLSLGRVRRVPAAGGALRARRAALRFPDVSPWMSED